MVDLKVAVEGMLSGGAKMCEGHRGAPDSSCNRWFGDDLPNMVLSGAGAAGYQGRRAALEDGGFVVRYDGSVVGERWMGRVRLRKAACLDGTSAGRRVSPRYIAGIDGGLEVAWVMQ
jgi:hypothetical protein